MSKSISIIIPFYNGESFYPNLLNSIKKAISVCDSAKTEFEIITIIDSIETKFDIVNELFLKCFKSDVNVTSLIIKNEKNIGVAGSRNIAILASKGNYLHIIDQDDIISENFYSEIIFLLDNYNFVLYNGKVDYTSNKYNSHKLYYLKPDLSIKGMLKNDFIRSPGQVVFLKKLLKNNLFPEPVNYKGADDRFFWLRIFMENPNSLKEIYVKNTGYIANIHNNNYSGDTNNLKRSTLESWDIFKSEINTSKYENLVQNDILRIKFALKEKMTLCNKFKGGWLNLVYFLEINKIVRFIIKRKIW